MGNRVVQCDHVVKFFNNDDGISLKFINQEKINTYIDDKLQHILDLFPSLPRHIFRDIYGKRMYDEQVRRRNQRRQDREEEEDEDEEEPRRQSPPRRRQSPPRRYSPPKGSLEFMIKSIFDQLSNEYKKSENGLKVKSILNDFRNIKNRKREILFLTHPDRNKFEKPSDKELLQLIFITLNQYKAFGFGKARKVRKLKKSRKRSRKSRKSRKISRKVRV